MPTSPFSAPARRKCNPVSVLPDPLGPAMSVVEPGQIPPPSISSSPSIPKRTRAVSRT
jgi:hypothetical protein